MKKLMMFVAIATMAFGAFAGVPEGYEFSYTWSVDINNIDLDYTLPKDLTVELFNSKGTRLAVLSQSMFGDDFKLATNKESGEFFANEYAKDQELRTYYESASLQLSKDDTRYEDRRKIHMTSLFYTPDNLMLAYSDRLHASDSLKVVLSGTDNTTGQKLYQTLEIGWAESGNSTFGASAEYKPTSVPEPTSGLLMLFGLAGLALKRKRA